VRPNAKARWTSPGRAPAAHSASNLAPAENNFVGKATILNWINTALQLRVERVEDVSEIAACRRQTTTALLSWSAHARWMLKQCAYSSYLAAHCLLSQSP
jgi:hypothetical protein